MNEKLIFIYTTWPDQSTAKLAAKKLIQSQLVACANLIPGMQSIYMWDSQLQETSETVMILKTKEGLFSKVEETLLAQHPYECPAIVAIPFLGGHGPYLQWLESTLKG